MDVNSYEKDKPKILVVDDEELVPAMTGLILEEEGYQVETCSTGKEDIDKINKSIYAVVLDINMPGLTGLEAFERILSVADVVDAIIPHRPYRPALGIDKALEELSNNGGIRYDSNVVDTCLSIITENRRKKSE